MITQKVNVKIALKHKVCDEATMLDKLIAKGIQVRTKSKYYHVELIVGDRWISADPKEGVYVNPLQPYISDKWTIIDLGEIELTNDNYNKVIKFIYDRVGDKYDGLGIFLSQFIKIGVDSKDRWFCSELVSKILQLLLVDEYINIVPNELSPGDIYLLSKFRLKE